MIIGDMEIRLRADIARLQRDMDSARQVVGNATAAIGRAADMAKAALSGIAGAAGLSKIAEMSDAYTKLTGQLRLATDSSRAYAQAYADVKRIANSAQADLGATGSLYASLTRATKELGVSQRTVADITEAVNLGFKISNAGAQETEGALIQLSQAFASGALRGDEFNSVNEAAPRLMQAIADSIGKPVGALRGMAEQGKLTAEVVATALPKALGQLQSEASQIQTISGAFTVLKNNVVEFTGVQAQASGAVSVITTGINAFANNLGLVAGAVAVVAGGRLLSWLSDAALNATAAVSANRALLASNVAVAESNAIEATQASLAANARLAEVRAATLAAEGNVQLALTTNALIPAEARATALAEAQSVALGQLTIAQRAASAGAAALAAGTSALNGALALTGGPLGLLVTVLGGAALAWSYYGDKAEEANRKAKESTEKSTQEIIDGLVSQGNKLRERLGLASQSGMSEIAKQGGEGVERLAKLRNEILALQDSVNAGTAGENGSLHLIELQYQYTDLANAIEGVADANKKLQGTSDAAVQLRQQLSGVGSAYMTELSKYQKGLEDGQISQAEYVALVKKLATDTYNASDAGKAYAVNIEAQAAAIQRAAEAQGLRNQRDQEHIQFLKDSGQADEETTIRAAAAAQVKDLNDQIAAQQRLLGVDSRRQETAEQHAEKQAEIRGKIANLRIQIDNAQAKRDEDLTLLEQKRYREAVNNTADLIEAAQAETKAQQDQTRDQQDYIETLGMTEKQIAAVTAARLRDQAAALDRRAELAIIDEVSEAYRQQAAELRKRADGTVFAEELKHQKEIWSSIEQTAHDTFVSIFDSGKSAFDRLRDALKNGLLDLLYQMTLKKWIISLQADVTGGLLGGAASAAGSSLGGGSSLTSAAGLASTASNLYKMVTGGFAGVSDMIAGGVQSAMSAMGYTPLASQGLATAGGQALTPTAAMAGQLGGAAVGGLAGHALNSAISGGYKVSSGLNTVSDIAATVASYFNPVFGAAIGALTGLVNRAFGRKAPEIQSQGLRGTYGADGSVTGETYQNIIEKGGYFRSDKKYTNTQSLTDEMQSQLGQSFKAITDASTVMAKSLGLGADTLIGYSKTFDVTLTSDAAKNQEAIATFFGGVADEVASKLVPTLASFSQSGESASATLQRLAGEFDATTVAVQNIGKTAAQAFGDVGLASATSRERLVQLAGGTSALTTLTGSYAQNFLTEAQRLEPVSKALDAALSQLSLSSIPTTRGEFAKLVSGLDLTNDAQAKQFVGLMQLNEAFALVHPETAAKALDERKTLQDELDELTMSSTELLKKQRAALDESNRALFDQVQAIKASSKLLGGVDDAFSVLEKVVSREKKAVQASIDAHTASVTKLQSLASSLHSTLNSMQSPEQQVTARADGQAQIRATLAAVRAGAVLPDADDLKDALSAVQKDASDQFSSYTDYLRDLYTTQNDIGALAGITDNQLTVEQQALEKAKAQLESLDGILDRAQQQIDELKGQSTTLLSIDQAIGGLAAAVRAAQQNPVVAATADINKAYQTALGRAPDAAGMQFWQGQAAAGTSTSDIVGAITGSAEAKNRQAIQKLYQDLLGRPADDGGLSFFGSSGASLEDISASIKQSDEYKTKIKGFANGGDFAGGVRLVGEVGPEIEVTGASRIHSTQSLMDALRNPSDSSAVLADAVDRLTATVERQRVTIEQQGAALDQIQRNTRRQADTLDVVTEGGNAMRTKEQV